MTARAVFVVALAVATLTPAAQAQRATAVGVTITLDGAEFHRQSITLKPITATYCNNWWESHRDPRVNRVAVCASDERPGWIVNINAPRGVSVFEKGDEDKADRNPYLGFELKFGGDLSARVFPPDRVEVTVTRIDPPGGRIEGTVRGTVIDRTRDAATITVTGTFSVIRGRDRVID